MPLLSVRVLETLARDVIGDAQSPNLYFVTDRGKVQTVTTDYPTARDHYNRLAHRLPRMECALEDRGYGCIADVAPSSDTPGARLVRMLAPDVAP